MPSSFEDHWINDQTATALISELKDTTIVVDASYYLQLFLANAPYQEPLLPALGGLTGIQAHFESDLDNWNAHNTTPFFVFNGQSVVGSDEITIKRGIRAIAGTDDAWSLYFQSQANEAVSAFGSHKGAYLVQNLYPLLQSILNRRGLYFKVAPVNAAAQLAYFDSANSTQCSAIMGSQELLLYPIQDLVIRYIDWDSGTFTGIQKKSLIKNLGVAESMFVDALLMTGTSFLPGFPPLKEPNITPRQPSSVQDAVNLLRTSEKSVTTACNSFNDILSKRDPNWLQKYRRARMSVDHFIYVDETGEIKVHNHENLTHDNWEYLGYRLPEELYHYLDRGLIGARLPSWISHGQIVVFPTLDGGSSVEYRRLITDQLMELRQLAIFLVLSRMNRGIQFKPIHVRVWYDDKYSHRIEYRPQDPQALKAIQQVHTWDVKKDAVQQHFPNAKHGSVLFEVTALKNPDFAKSTVTKAKIKNIASSDLILSITLWRYLHLRGFVNDSHQLTPWGEALAKSLEALEPTAAKYPTVPGLFEAVLHAYELLRLDLLNTRNEHSELGGLPMNGSDDDKASLLLISRCTILLKLRHQANGYTGPLSKNFLCFRSLSSSVRESCRDLFEAIVASLFLYAQAEREREDYLHLGQSIPFLTDTDVALGIAVKTFLDDISPSETAEQKATKKAEFPGKFVPYATNFFEDLDIACDFFNALHVGVKTLTKEISGEDRAVWDKAATYLELRR
ncbi:putative xpg domain-containing protein [Rosellinia necatrix]|uniref:Putative xpg domain-containing protein n=1 Tax=Rosellinia necatrix TaxID=77044 RepID=A0A1S7ULI4_ROSNE|nr:putative xpg domain-containing protein [Rosellinia necatrix]